MAQQILPADETSGGSRRHSTWRRLRASWITTPGADWIAPPLTGAAAWVALAVFGRTPTGESSVDAGLMAAVLGAAVSTVSGLLTGMSTTTMAMYTSGTGPAMKWLRYWHGAAMRTNWLAIIRGFLAATALGIFTLITAQFNASAAVVIGAAAFGLLGARALRVLYLMGKYLPIADNDRVAEAGGAPTREDIAIR